jgi:hypothetical protein
MEKIQSVRIIFHMARSFHNFFGLKKLLQADAFHLKIIFKTYVTPKPRVTHAMHYTGHAEYILN